VITGEAELLQKPNHCGSGLARDGGLTFNIEVGWQIAIAGSQLHRD
jgi:hypothetical protein